MWVLGLEGDGLPNIFLPCRFFPYLCTSNTIVNLMRAVSTGNRHFCIQQKYFSGEQGKRIKINIWAASPPWRAIL